MSKLCLSLLNWAPPSAHWVLMGSLLWWQLQSNHNNMVKYHIQDQLPSVLKFVLRGQEGHFNMVETCRRVGSLTGDTWGDVQHPLLGTILPIMPLGPHHDCHLIPAPSIRQSISPLCPTGVTTTPSEIGMLQSPSPHTHTQYSYSWALLSLSIQFCHNNITKKNVAVQKRSCSTTCTCTR